jgi:hypothetical protein
MISQIENMDLNHIKISNLVPADPFNSLGYFASEEQNKEENCIPLHTRPTDPNKQNSH